MTAGMLGPARTAGPIRPINPFLLPAATTSRFVLLIVVTLSSAAYTYDLVVGGPSGWRDAYGRCDRMADATASRSPAETLAGDYLSCLHGVGLDRVTVSLVAIGVVACAIAILHRLRPRLTIRRQGLVAADPEAHADLLATVRDLAAAEGLRRPPRVLLDMNRLTPDGRAFGRYPRYHMRLNVGVLLAEAEHPGTVRSVVLHELAHLRNGDVAITNLTLTSSWVYGGLVAAPLLLATAVLDPSVLGVVAVQLVLSGLLIVLLAAAVLRSREHYADVRAAWAGGRLLTRGPLGGWRRLIPLHPSDTRRKVVFRDPGVLMGWNAAESLAAGVAAGLGIPYLAALLKNVLEITRPVHAMVLATVVYAVLVAAVVGAGAGRASLRALASGQPVRRTLLPGMALATGLLVGTLLTPAPIDEAWFTAVARSPLLAVGLFVVLVAACVLFSRWLVSVAVAWLPVARGRSLLWVVLGGLVPAALVFGLWLGWWYVAFQITLDSESAVNGLYVLGAAFFDPLLLTVVVLAAVYPLASWFRFAGPGVPRTLHLDGSAHTRLPPVAVQPFMALTPVLFVLVAMIVANVVLPEGVLMTLVREIVPAPAVTDPGVATPELVQVVGAFIALVALSQVVVAVVVALIAGRGSGPGSAHGIYASVVVAWVMTATLIAPHIELLCPSGAGCEPLPLGNRVAAMVVPAAAVGVPATVVALMGVAALRGIVRALGARPAATAPPTPAPRWLRWGGLALAAAVVAGWVVVVGPLWLSSQGFTANPRTILVPPSTRAVPPPGLPGIRPVRSACAEIQWTAYQTGLPGSELTTVWATVFAHVAETDRPALIAFGRAGYAAARAGNLSVGLWEAAVIQYCGRV